ncbi:MAG: M23 family metallopeptidase [Patescibacteria group bacterium]|nr:M23 family metallopeptidase [Patescibacteria group bacterium]
MSTNKSFFRKKKGTFLQLEKLLSKLPQILLIGEREVEELGRQQLILFGLENSRSSSFSSDFFVFCYFLVQFLGRKLRILALAPFSGVKFLYCFGKDCKQYLVQNLVWGGGRLFAPVTRFGILVFALGVFVLGGTGLVRSKSIYTAFDKDGDILAHSVSSSPVSFTNTPSGDPIEYVVKEGDTLSSIGDQFKVSIASIRYVNDLGNVNYIKPGQKLTIPPVSGILHTVEKGDTVRSLANKYDVAPQSIVDFNYLFHPFNLEVGQVIVVPGGSVPEQEPATSHLASGRTSTRQQEVTPSVGTGQFSWPTNSRGISQYFHRWHPAIDISRFSPIYAIDSGTVVEARYSGWNYGYGKLVRIDHGNGYTSLYAHLSSVKVQPGQNVSRGQIIGNMGNTGRSFGTHLHLEITYQGRHINPLSVL